MRENPSDPARVLVETTDYKGRVFTDFYPQRGTHEGPGWFVFGRNEGYGGNLVKLVARPDVAPRRHPHFNVRVRAGWRTKREAQAIADELNAGRSRPDVPLSTGTVVHHRQLSSGAHELFTDGDDEMTDVEWDEYVRRRMQGNPSALTAFRCRALAGDREIDWIRYAPSIAEARRAFVAAVQSEFPMTIPRKVRVESYVPPPGYGGAVFPGEVVWSPDKGWHDNPRRERTGRGTVLGPTGPNGRYQVRAMTHSNLTRVVATTDSRALALQELERYIGAGFSAWGQVWDTQAPEAKQVIEEIHASDFR